MKILLADDDALAVHVIGATVRRFGHECLTATDGDAAWALFQEMQPDVVISDLSMPGLGGADLCRRIRAHQGARRAHFIVMTGHDDDASLEECTAAGADDYLVKPVSFDELEIRLCKAARALTMGALPPNPARG
jgi:CheY-like chemotaxis protein